MLVFFAVSGVWQCFQLNYLGPDDSRTLALASTAHTQRPVSLKSGEVLDLSSPALRGFVVAMAVGMIVTTVLGVVMAYRFGKGRAASICLTLGVVLPAALVLIKVFT